MPARATPIRGGDGVEVAFCIHSKLAASALAGAGPEPGVDRKVLQGREQEAAETAPFGLHARIPPAFQETGEELLGQVSASSFRKFMPAK